MPDKEFMEQYRRPVMFPNEITSQWKLPPFNQRSKVVEKRIQNVTINFGPQHPAAHGVLRLVLTLDGERCRKTSRTQEKGKATAEMGGLREEGYEKGGGGGRGGGGGVEIKK
ncbi:NADH dehydrogenase [ubiquinone] iron-sulfur protein 2, mitochondrial [Lamellibrachia satsuma]|nr:NADH dehydrogenase [ubiquinone] iron-sulfur protein 2, mitochondrial [Lamellibrachia satsuma]